MSAASAFSSVSDPFCEAGVPANALCRIIIADVRFQNLPSLPIAVVVSSHH
jgi:hypothetical protein